MRERGREGERERGREGGREEGESGIERILFMLVLDYFLPCRLIWR